MAVRLPRASLEVSCLPLDSSAVCLFPLLNPASLFPTQAVRIWMSCPKGFAFRLSSGVEAAKVGNPGGGLRSTTWVCCMVRQVWKRCERGEHVLPDVTIVCESGLCIVTAIKVNLDGRAVEH